METKTTGVVASCVVRQYFALLNFVSSARVIRSFSLSCSLMPNQPSSSWFKGRSGEIADGNKSGLEGIKIMMLSIIPNRRGAAITLMMFLFMVAFSFLLIGSVGVQGLSRASADDDCFSFFKEWNFSGQNTV